MSIFIDGVRHQIVGSSGHFVLVRAWRPESKTWGNTFAVRRVAS